MAEKAALGSEFASWTTLPEGPLGQALSAAKSVAIGYGIPSKPLNIPAKRNPLSLFSNDF